MLAQLTHPTVTDFNKETLTKLKSYFDIDFINASSSDRQLWFTNLMTLGKHSLGVAHMIQHNQSARISIEFAFKDVALPEFYQKNYDDLIGCFCGYKSTDTIQLKHNHVSGTKHWTSFIDRADFGILRVVDQAKQKAFVLFDFAAIDYTIDSTAYTPIGMEIARPASFTINNVIIPDNYILGYQGTQEMFQVSNFHDYCFITNFLSCTIALFQQIKTHAEKNNCGAKLNLDKLEISIATLKMLWEDNLYTVNETESTDQFWHRRNTQYVQGKSVLISLITLALELGNSYYLDAKSPVSQIFRDALMLSSHQGPLYKNAQDMYFVNL